VTEQQKPLLKPEVKSGAPIILYRVLVHFQVILILSIVIIHQFEYELCMLRAVSGFETLSVTVVHFMFVKIAMNSC